MVLPGQENFRSGVRGRECPSHFYPLELARLTQKGEGFNEDLQVKPYTPNGTVLTVCLLSNLGTKFSDFRRLYGGAAFLLYIQLFACRSAMQERKPIRTFSIPDDLPKDMHGQILKCEWLIECLAGAKTFSQVNHTRGSTDSA